MLDVASNEKALFNRGPSGCISSKTLVLENVDFKTPKPSFPIFPIPFVPIKNSSFSDIVAQVYSVA